MNMKSKKIDLTRTVAAKTGFTIKDVKLVIDTFVEEMGNEILKGNDVHLANFGKFFIKESPARYAMNPYEQKKIHIEARKHLKFQPTLSFKKRLQ